MNSRLYILSPAHDYLLEIYFPQYDPPKKENEKANKLKPPASLVSFFDGHFLQKMKMGAEVDFMKISDSGTVLYLGSNEFLRICDRDPQKKGLFKTQEFNESNYDFQDMKEVEMTYLGYTMASNNWFELLSLSLEEVARLKTKGHLRMDKNLRKQAFTGSDGHDEMIYLWNMANGSVGVIDLKKMEYDIVPDLGSATGNQSLAHAIISTSNGRKLLSLTTIKNSESYFVNFWAKGREGVVTQPIEYINEKGKQPYSLTLSQDN